MRLARGAAALIAAKNEKIERGRPRVLGTNFHARRNSTGGRRKRKREKRKTRGRRAQHVAWWPGTSATPRPLPIAPPILQQQQRRKRCENFIGKSTPLTSMTNSWKKEATSPPREAAQLSLMKCRLTLPRYRVTRAPGTRPSGVISTCHQREDIGRGVRRWQVGL